MKSTLQLTTAAAGAVLIVLGHQEVHAQAPPYRVDFGAMSSLDFQFDPAPAALVDEEDTWWFQPSIAIWAPSIDGTVGARGLTTSVHKSFADILDDSDSIIGISGSFELGVGKWSGFVKGTYAKIGVDQSTPFGTASLTTELALLGFGISYELGSWPMEYTASATKPARDLKLDVYAGGRYTSVGTDFDFPVLPSLKQTRNWVDPIIGAAVNVPLSQNWSIDLDGNVGGFGAASDFTWAAMGLISWDFYIGDLPSSLQLGYIAVGDDYSKGSGTDQFVWDTILHGPAINFLIRF